MIATAPHKLPAVPYTPPRCLTCAHWSGVRSRGPSEPGKCRSPTGRYAGGVVAGRETCNRYEPD